MSVPTENDKLMIMNESRVAISGLRSLPFHKVAIAFNPSSGGAKTFLTAFHSGNQALTFHQLERETLSYLTFDHLSVIVFKVVIATADNQRVLHGN